MFSALTSNQLQSYYQPSLSDPREQPRQLLTGKPQNFYESAYPSTRLLTAGAIVGGLFASGYLPFRHGNLWDKYVAGLRAIESYSPAGMLRTFQLSNFFSQFESANIRGTFITPKIFSGNVPLTDYVTKLIGQGEGPRGRLISEGLTLRNRRLFWGQGEEIALRHASSIRTPLSIWDPLTGTAITTGSQLGSGWEAIIGATSPRANYYTFSQPDFHRPLIRNPLIGSLPGQLIGGQSRLQYASRWGRAVGTELVGRFNRLLEMPYGLIEGIPGAKYLPRLAVKPGTGGQMFARMVGKFGIALPALALGYQTLDWATRRADIFDDTILDEGITAGIATTGVRANILASSVAQATGLQKYRAAQEEIAPGSTSLQKLLAFPLMGALGAAGGLYGVKVAKMAYRQMRGATAHAALTETELAMREFGAGGNVISRTARRIAMGGPSSIYQSPGRIGDIFRKILEPAAEGSERLAVRKLGWRIGPSRFAAITGGLIGLGLIAPFLPGALIPEKSPEELRQIYSGEKEVAVRRGRFWEMGKTAFEGENETYYRPHWLPRMLTRGRERGIWGENEDEMSPLEKLYKREFTYQLEREHYYDRPYPVSSLPFEDVPLIGPLLANTIGRLIKPPRLMHETEWNTGEGPIAPSPGFGQRIATELGELPGPQPISPYDIRGTIGEQAYRMTEMVGLPGFAATSIKEALTGTPDLFDQRMQLESARRLGGFEREYWDLEVGGAAGASELFRRLFPHRRRCLLPGTGILLGDGRAIPIEEVIPGNSVITHTGNIKVVQEVTSNLVDEDVLTVKTKYNNIPITLTKDHLVRCIRTHHCTTRGKKAQVPCVNRCKTCDKRKCTKDFYRYYKPEWVPAGELTTLDFIQVPARIGQRIQKTINSSLYIPKETIEDIENKDYILSLTPTRGKLNSIRKKKSWTAIKHYISLDYDCGLYLGLYLAEGCLSGNSITFNFATEEQSYRDFVHKYSHSILFHRYGGKLTSDKDCSSRGVISTSVHSVLIRALLDKLVGGLAHTKKIHPYLLDASDNGFLLGLIVGFFRGDGGNYQYKTTTIRASATTASKALAFQIREILLYLGYVPSLGRYEKRNRFAHAKEVYEIRLEGKDAKRIALLLEKGTIDFTTVRCKDANRRVITRNEGTYFQIKSIVSSLYQGRVFNLEVEKDQSFATDIGVVHNSIPLYNPIPNEMPLYMPGAGEKSPDFRTGDPMGKIPEGEIRLPGPGYEARYPELKGISPEEYPLIHRWKILADVAPYSTQYGQSMEEIRAARKGKDWTSYEENVYQQTIEQLKARKNRKEFQEYKYLSPMGNIFSSAAEKEKGVLAQLNEIKKAGIEEPSLFSKLFGGYWELLSHNAETALDQMTPISPGAKLVHQRTAIESYEREQLYGTAGGFWNHPIRDFMRPSAYLLAQSAGYKGVPKHIESKRKLEEYFDTLKYVKYTRLANMARLAEDKEALKEFEAKKDQTLFGINPYTRNYTSIFKSLPRRERDYFNAFAEADTEQERARVLEIVPENEKSLYIARWRLAFADDVRRAEKANLLSSEQIIEAEEITKKIYDEARTEGYPSSKQDMADYIETRLPDENYGDWYRRTKLLPRIPLPGPDYVGFHPSVNLEDIKLKVVQHLGEDQIDFDIWPSQSQTLMNKPYINDQAIEEILEPPDLSASETRSRIEDLLLTERLNAKVFARSSWGTKGLTVNISHTEDEDYGE